MFLPLANYVCTENQRGVLEFEGKIVVCVSKKTSKLWSSNKYRWRRINVAQRICQVSSTRFGEPKPSFFLSARVDFRSDYRRMTGRLNGAKKAKTRRGRRCAGFLILTDNWEEECCQSNRATLGGGVRRFDDLKILRFSPKNSQNIAVQHCAKCITNGRCIALSRVNA